MNLHPFLAGASVSGASVGTSVSGEVTVSDSAAVVSSITSDLAPTVVKLYL